MAEENSGEPAAEFKTAADEATEAESAAAAADRFSAYGQRSMMQSKEVYARLRGAAEDASRTLETTMETAHHGSLSLSKKAMEVMRSNAEMGFAHIDSLMAARSLAEVIELQSSYLRRQVEIASDQIKEMQSLSQAVTRDVMTPGREALERATRRG
ncbi:phasin family protein [Aurantimonas sp. MSK8Z-1]|uniref:phasin family protein n=1 Tax=Mangrovibrevibacter kandeliae TaxID=2968473 RepID=UPI00211905A5|nr:phasin family protein [Aurantimonas sp. MSK8Z-1]MCW4113566.1 phasin family protein [Aurantimonas sp. MSK8Z-1]